MRPGDPSWGAMKESPSTRSPGALVRPGENDPVVVTRSYRVWAFADGLWAILIAALAVFVGAFPVVPPERASAKREEQLADDAPEEPTHIARMLASVLTFDCGARAL